MEQALIITSVIVATTNAGVIFMVLAIKELRTFTNYFLVSLAVSDLLTGAVVLPLRLYPYTVALDILQFNIFIGGVLNLCAVTWERLVAVSDPFRYKEKLLQYQKKIVIAIWLIPLLISLIPLAWKVDLNNAHQKRFLVSTLLLLVIIPYVFIAVSYVRIWLCLRSHAKQMKRIDMTVEQREGARRASLESKAAKVFAVIVCVFLVSWLPVIYMTLVCFVLNKCNLIPKELEAISLFTIGTSSLVNPILYAFMKKDFVAQLRRLMNFIKSSSQIHPVDDSSS